jgi:hypothetical protein
MASARAVEVAVPLAAEDADADADAEADAETSAEADAEALAALVALVASLPAGAPEAGLVASPCPPPVEDGDWLLQATSALSPIAARASRAEVDLSGCRSMRASLGRRAPARSSETMEGCPTA